LRVLVPYSKTLYFVDLGGTQRGMSYDFMHAFEAALNAKRKLREPLRIEMIPMARDELLPALLAGRGDVIAANLTLTQARLAQVDFTVPLARNIRELIVTGPGAPPIATLDDLAGKEVFVRFASSYHESLLALNNRFKEQRRALIVIRELPGHFETEDIFEMTNAGIANIVVADDYLARLGKRLYPNLRVREDLVLRHGGDIGFAIRKQSPKLMAELNQFAKTHRQGTLFGNVTVQKYLVQTRWAKNPTSPNELKRFTTLLNLFQKYGERYRVDWLLIAAQGYQESQLDQSRRSPVGAIGIMQVMPATGAQMRVGDITQLEPNVHAGVKYVRHLIDEYFDEDSVDDLNKALFAFAAYNCGPNRVRALRHEARLHKLNPDVWFNNVERIASQRIGRETVQYVSNIYKYYFAYSRVQGNVQRSLERTATK
jgi:membrane-bound lytic murein transglycosylase MltF